MMRALNLSCLLYLMSGVWVIFIAGCESIKEFKMTPLLEKESFSARQVPAKISKETIDALKKSGYVNIGYVELQDKVNSCWGNDCDNFECTSKFQHKDTTNIILEKAGSQGADLVVLENDASPIVSSVYKKGKCTGWFETEVPVQRCTSGYSPTCTTVYQLRRTCQSWETVAGKECNITSRGTAWRKDPELVKHLASENRVKEYKSGVEAYTKYKARYEQKLRYSEDKKLKYGYEIKAENVFIEPRFTGAHLCFSEGLAGVAVGEGDNKKWGFIDKKGKWVVKPIYESVGYLHDGLASVKQNGLWGVIDANGQLIVRPIFKDIRDFSEGMAAVELDKEGKVGFIDKTGNIVIKSKFDYAGSFFEGMARVIVGKKYGYIDTRGNIIIEPQFEYAKDFFKGIAEVMVGGGVKKYIDLSGKFL